MGYATVAARLALAAGLLSAVADRFGVWGAPGRPNVTWGDWGHFVAYTAQVNSFAPARWAPALAGLATAAEITFGVCLLLGLLTRWSALAAAGLFVVFASAMSVSLGPKAPLDYSVWGDVGCALLLFSAGVYPWSLDALRSGRTSLGRAKDAAQVR